MSSHFLKNKSPEIASCQSVCESTEVLCSFVLLKPSNKKNSGLLIQRLKEQWHACSTSQHKARAYLVLQIAFKIRRESTVNTIVYMHIGGLVGRWIRTESLPKGASNVENGKS